MMDLTQLLSVLSDGRFHSGADLGERLGVSRTTIWKAFDRLSELGLEHESLKGKGYRLLNPLDLITTERIEQLLPPDELSRADVFCVLQCGSTNSEVSTYRSRSSAPYTFLFSEKQTAGRGRRGRTWESPFAENIYMSCCFDWHQGPAGLQGLSLVVGIVVAEVLKELGVRDVGLKWPNDVWIAGEKVAGILIELEGEVTTSWRVTIGLGVNTHMQQESGRFIDQAWTAVGDHVSVSRSKLAAKLLEGLIKELDAFSVHGFEQYKARYTALDALLGEQVDLMGPNISGVVMGIDSDAALLLQTSDGLEAFHAGELSVRKQ